MSGTMPAGGPVNAGDRINYLDVLRGFAVMAIFVVNIKAMLMPLSFYANPSLWATEMEQTIAIVQKYLVDDKWRTTFTALYGAGLMMIADRLRARGEGRGTLLKRNLWLIVFGAVHLLLIWPGDILFIYGVTGLLAMLFVGMKTSRLFVVGALALVLGGAWMAFFSAGPAFNEELFDELKPMFWQPTEESLAKEIATGGGGIAAQLAGRAEGAFGYIVFYFLLGGAWLLSLGLMVLGMALFRTGLYRGVWPVAVTLPLAVVALLGAWALDGVQVSALAASDYSFTVASLQGWMGIIDGILGAFGYGCLISALISIGLKFGPVAAVGRMAFTNYIACSLIGTTLAGGHAFGLFGQVDLYFHLIVVGITFAAMLIISPLWLKAYRFGPLEWLWRSLVYGQKQPMKRA